MTVLLVIITIIVSCNSENRQQSTNYETGQVLKQLALIGSQSNSTEAIIRLIEKSGIRNGGYVVIISTSLNSKASKDIKKLFNRQNIMAVHIIEPVKDSDIKNSEVMAIGNASIICLPDGNRNRFMKQANNSRLKESLLLALENGSMIAGFGNGVTVIGDYYFYEYKNKETQKENLAFKPGLGLLKNTTIDYKVLFDKYTKNILTKCKQKNFTFLALTNNNSIWMQGDSFVVLGSSPISIISPDNKNIAINVGEAFGLPSE